MIPTPLPDWTERHRIAPSVRRYERSQLIDMEHAMRERACLPTWVLVAFLAFGVTPATAGGPLFVAGSGFNAGMAGTPLTWAGGQITYFTDQGDLSPLLPSAMADQFVADAFSRWTSVSTAALSVTRAGQLGEDVSGANVIRSGVVLNMPADIQPSSSKAFAIVYDFDGKVIDALLGTGASQDCRLNGVIGGPDLFSNDAHIAHALLILNGNCARAASDLPALRYSLVRMIGRSLGLDWSQIDDNVATGAPAPTADDQAGYPLMHPSGSLCTPAYGCIYNADQLRLDDRAAISRLYPVTAENIGQFSGKAVFASSTARIQGRVTFPAWNSSPGTGMQGVNIVARYLDPATGQPSHAMSASSVSGFLFHGNAGNEITGAVSATGERFDHWGSSDQSLRGFFDLSGLEIPPGQNSAQYQISVESINPAYVGALAVGPFRTSQVAPSGNFTPVVVTVTRGGDVVQDIVMQQAAAEPQDLTEPHSFEQPAAIPSGGNWTAALGAYGDNDWFRFAAAANRSFTLDVTALDDSGTPATTKALPVIGVWAADALESDNPAVSQTWFNAAGATTRLQAAIVVAQTFKVSIADARGDGRPDFRYRARLLYISDITPAQATAGTVLHIIGVGFVSGMKVQVSGVSAAVISYSPEELLVSTPALADGVKDLSLTDPATGATASVTGALTYGAAVGATLQLLSGVNPPVAVGSTAPIPFRVRVLAFDGTPVPGAAVTFSAPGTALSLLPCNTTTCIVATDGTGEADAWMLVKTAGATTATATIANGRSVSASVQGVTGTLQITAVPPKMFIAENTSASVPLLARVFGNGVALPDRLVKFQLMLGSGSLTTTSAITDAEGEAHSVLNLVNLASEVRVSACVGPDTQPACDTFYAKVVPVPGGLELMSAGGGDQYLSNEETFLPVTVRVFDRSTLLTSISGVPIHFHVDVYRVQSGSVQQSGEVLTGYRPQPVAVFTSDVTVYSDGCGEASYAPQILPAWGEVRIEITASMDTRTVRFTLHTLGVAPVDGSGRDRSLRRALKMME